MKTPLILFYNLLPIEIIDIIQKYLINDIAKNAVIKYYDKISSQQLNYDKFIFYNYVKNNCYCLNIPLEEGICEWCNNLHHSNTYNLEKYNLVINNNSQFNHLLFYL
jgi:hypothetical protein